MRIVLHIGPDIAATERLQTVLGAKRAQLASKGVLFARSPNANTHTRLFMAVTEPNAPDALRMARGFGTPQTQSGLRRDLEKSLLAELDRHRPDLLILCCPQLASLTHQSEIARLHALLRPYSDDIRILAHVEDPARMLLRHYAAQLLDGRVRSPALELSLLDKADWWDAALATRPEPAPRRGIFQETQMAIPWLDIRRWVVEWETVFGAGAMQLRAYDPAAWTSEMFTEEIRAAFGIETSFGKADVWKLPAPPPAAWLTRCRLFNEALLRLMRLRGRMVPRVLWRRMLGQLMVTGPAAAPGALHRISAHFAANRDALLARHPDLTLAALTPDAALPDWSEAEPKYGFRATQYLLAFRPMIESALKAQDKSPEVKALSPDAARLMPPLAKEKFKFLHTSPYAPHNNLGQVAEDKQTTAYPLVSFPKPAKDRSGTVIVACMKNEGPYILEWIAHHRAIGVDSFVIYTNGCEDPTDPLLQRLQALGILHHRDNEGWTGPSPQQYALDNAVKDPVVQAADWVAHIDVDEFINIRFGTGTLPEFLAQVPQATHVAMTWRLFGNNGVQDFDDRLVTEQFDICAPSHLPKPHIGWGFKTLGRPNGAYRKLSCHRPNGLRPDRAGDVHWVNGSGQDMTAEVLKNGWRNSKKSIGYDLLQLNHYPLRSADSFLVKRQRGRALHVDRSIGLNYWIRMDWSGARDITIQRNLPRVRAELAQLKSDTEVASLHSQAVKWHRTKAQELRTIPEFADLYAQVTSLRLTPTERAAFALALDMES